MKKRKYRSYVGKRRFPLWRLLLALVIAGAVVFAALEVCILANGRDRIEGEPKFMVVLGCQVRDDGPSILLQDRLDTALDYLTDHSQVSVVVCGAQGENEPSTEAQAMADYLAQRGVEWDRIILEEGSFNTMQNLLYARRLLEAQGFDPSRDGVVIVSNGFHLARAKMLAGRLGYGDVSTLAAPTSHWPTAVKMFFREPLALVKSFVFDWE